MVPSTQNVTLLVMAPVEWINGEAFRGKRRPTLHVVTNNRIRSADNGTLLEASIWDVRKKFVEKFADYFGSFDALDPKKAGGPPIDSFEALAARFSQGAAKSCPSFGALKYKLRGETAKAGDLQAIFIGYLFDRVVYNDHRCFLAALNALHMPLNEHAYLWNELAELSSTFGEGEALIELPLLPRPAPPLPQTALLNDDGKAGATVRLAGGRGLVADRLMAVLMNADSGKFAAARTTGIADAGRPIVFARKIDVIGSDVQISFAPLAPLCGQAPAGADYSGTLRAYIKFTSEDSVAVTISAANGEITNAVFADTKPANRDLKRANGLDRQRKRLR